MSKKIIFLNILFLLCTNILFADSIRISQIDSLSLLLNQQIKLYLSVTDDNGIAVENVPKNRFTIYESPDGLSYTKIDTIQNFNTRANYESGINFLLLIDNSGSMYRTMEGKRTNNKNKMRITYAKNAAVTFLKSITNPKDKIGLAIYNSYYNSFSDPTNDKIKIEKYLQKIKKPTRDEACTEIYSSIYLAVDEFLSIRGRKTIIILSDGENQPYSLYTGKKHKIFEKKIFKFTEPLEYCQKEGVSVFSVYFGKRGGQKDKNLNKIAVQTGGAVFDAYNQQELCSIYKKIVNQILEEYLITYKATMDPADKKYVKVECRTTSGINSVSRFYFSSTVFGMPLKNFNPLLILPFFLAFLLLWALSRFDFEKQKSDPTLEVLNPGTAKTSTKIFSLGEGKTIIGGSSNADMTIIGGVSKIKEKHATITFDNKKKNYTIVGDGALTVNNKTVKTRVLEQGDVLNIGGTIVVFDDGEVE